MLNRRPSNAGAASPAGVGGMAMDMNWLAEGIFGSSKLIRARAANDGSCGGVGGPRSSEPLSLDSPSVRRDSSSRGRLLVDRVACPDMPIPPIFAVVVAADAPSPSGRPAPPTNERARSRLPSRIEPSNARAVDVELRLPAPGRVVLAIASSSQTRNRGQKGFL